jgi:hypothetical protein
MIICSRPLSDLNRVLSRLFIVHSLAVLGIFGGIIPAVRLFPPALPWGHIAYAQTFSATQIQQYAQALLAIEVERKTAYTKIQALLGRVPPAIVCNQKETFQGLPQNAQLVAVNFCNQSQKLAQKLGLSSQDFNRITEVARQDSSLKQRIQRAIAKERKAKGQDSKPQ